MKKNKLTKLLKIGILFFVISLLLWNCEKDEVLLENSTTISLEKVKSIYRSDFNKKTFVSLIKEPLWEETKVLFIDGREYLEIPFRIVKQKELDKSTSMSNDRLLAFISPNNKLTVNVIHYFAQDIKKSMPDFQNLSFFKIGNFNGFVTLYDLNKNLISLNKFKNGIRSNKQYTITEKKKNDDNVFYRMPTDCEMHTETIVIESCWFWYYHNTGTTEIINCFYDYNTISYQTCDINGEGGVRSSGETKIVVEDIIELDEFLAQDTWDTQNPYDDWNRLTDCEKDFFTSNPSTVPDAIRNRKKAEAAAYNRFNHCTNTSGKVNLRNNIGDAYRHAYFSALNTKSMGYSNASSIGDAHECDTPASQLSEKVMDLHNNSYGYNYSLNHISLTENQFYQDFISANNNGNIKTLTPCN